MVRVENPSACRGDEYPSGIGLRFQPQCRLQPYAA